MSVIDSRINQSDDGGQAANRDVPGCWRIDIGIDPASCLACVVQAILRAETRIVGQQGNPGLWHQGTCLTGSIQEVALLELLHLQQYLAGPRPTHLSGIHVGLPLSGCSVCDARNPLAVSPRATLLTGCAKSAERASRPSWKGDNRKKNRAERRV